MWRWTQTWTWTWTMNIDMEMDKDADMDVDIHIHVPKRSGDWKDLHCKQPTKDHSKEAFEFEISYMEYRIFCHTFLFEIPKGSAEFYANSNGTDSIGIAYRRNSVDTLVEMSQGTCFYRLHPASSCNFIHDFIYSVEFLSIKKTLIKSY